MNAFMNPALPASSTRNGANNNDTDANDATTTGDAITNNNGRSIDGSDPSTRHTTTNATTPPINPTTNVANAFAAMTTKIGVRDNNAGSNVPLKISPASDQPTRNMLVVHAASI